MRVRTRPIGDWGPGPAIRSIVVPRHHRPDAFHRRRYYRHHWPDRAPHDLLEHPGRWAPVWSAAGVVGLLALIDALIEGTTAARAGWLNVSLFVLLLVAHATNALRSRRRRSLLLTPVLAGGAACGALVTLGVLDMTWDDLFVVTFVFWVPIAAADVVAPTRTYAARRAPHNLDGADHQTSQEGPPR